MASLPNAAIATLVFSLPAIAAAFVSSVPWLLPLTLIAAKLAMVQAIKVVVAGVVLPDDTHVAWATWLGLFAADAPPVEAADARPWWHGWRSWRGLRAPISPRRAPPNAGGEHGDAIQLTPVGTPRAEVSAAGGGHRGAQPESRDASRR